MKKDFITIKKDLGNLIKAGTYDKQTIMNMYPYMNFGDPEFFSLHTVDILDIGIKVKYQNQSYYIVDYGENIQNIWTNATPVRFSATIKQDASINMHYIIAPSMTAREKDKKRVSTKDLTILPTYYFINSEGNVCQDFYGRNARTDEWRSKDHNIFKTKEEADNHRTAVLHPSKVEPL